MLDLLLDLAVFDITCISF